MAGVLAAEKARTDLPPGFSRAETDAVLDALEQGGRAARRQVGDLAAAYLTVRMSDAQLAAATEFWRGPTGVAWKAKSGELSVISRQMGFEAAQHVWRDAGQVLCRTLDCPGVAATAPPKAPSQSRGASAAPSTRTP